MGGALLKVKVPASRSSIRPRPQPHGLAGKPALGGRQQIEAEQTNVAPQRNQRLGAAEQSRDLIREAHSEVLIQALALAIRLYRCEVAQRFVAGEQRGGQGIGIAKAIVSLSLFHEGRMFMQRQFKAYNEDNGMLPPAR